LHDRDGDYFRCCDMNFLNEVVFFALLFQRDPFISPTTVGEVSVGKWAIGEMNQTQTHTKIFRSIYR